MVTHVYAWVLANLSQLCPTLCSPMNCSPPDSSVRGTPQARTLEWIAMPSFRGSSWPRHWTCVPYIPCIPDPGTEPVSPMCPAWQSWSSWPRHWNCVPYIPCIPDPGTEPVSPISPAFLTQALSLCPLHPLHSWPRHWTCVPYVPCMAVRIFLTQALNLCPLHPLHSWPKHWTCVPYVPCMVVMIFLTQALNLCPLHPLHSWPRHWTCVPYIPCIPDPGTEPVFPTSPAWQPFYHYCHMGSPHTCVLLSKHKGLCT